MITSIGCLFSVFFWFPKSFILVFYIILRCFISLRAAKDTNTLLIFFNKENNRNSVNIWCQYILKFTLNILFCPESIFCFTFFSFIQFIFLEKSWLHFVYLLFKIRFTTDYTLDYSRQRYNNPFFQPTIMFKMFLMVEQIFLLPKVKQSVIFSNKLVYTSCLTSCRTT